MKISLLAGIVLGMALLFTSLGVMAKYGVIAKPLSALERAQQQIEAVNAQAIPDIQHTTTLELAEKSIDFGIHEEGVEVEKEFTFKNVGQHPLRITGIKPSCGCITVKEESLTVAPGETGKLTVAIDTTKLSGPVEKFLLLKTNDREHGEMAITVNAVVTVPVEVTPQRIVFSRLLADDTVTRELKVFSRLDAPFEITGARMLRPDTEKFFQVEYRPLEPAEFPEEAKSGWQVTVTVLPGLPTGSFKQMVNLLTSVEKSPEVMFEVEGSVVNDISVVAIGADFNPKYNLLSLGPLKQDRGARVKLKMLVAGDYRDTLEIGTPVCEPDFLKVTVGERKSLNNGTASEVTMEIEIPPGSPVVSMLDDAASVTLPTNHSSMKEVKILLHFAVEK